MNTPDTLEFGAAYPLGFVNQFDFDNFHEFTKMYGDTVVLEDGTERIGIDFYLTSDGHSRILGKSYWERTLDTFPFNDAVDVTKPFLTASREWLIKTADLVYFAHSDGLVLPGATLRQPRWHRDGTRSNSFKRSANFSDGVSTIVATGALHGEVLDVFNEIVKSEAEDPPAKARKENLFDAITKIAIGRGMLSTTHAVSPFQGAGLTPDILHSSPPNTTATPMKRSFLGIAS